MEMAKVKRTFDVDQVYFLIFELSGQLYGVGVEQVEAIIEGEGSDGLCSYEGQEIPLQDLAVWVGLGLPKGGGASRVLVSRSGGGLRGFVVNTPKDVVALPLEDIFPIPPLIRQVLGPSPLWGVGRWPAGLILLVDLAMRGG